MNYFSIGGFSPFGGGFVLLGAAIVLWSLIWKGLALWKAARKGENVWFIALLIVNTLGILEILYIYAFSKPKGIDKTSTTNNS